MTIPVIQNNSSTPRVVDDSTGPDIDERRMIRRGAAVIAVGFGGFLLWSVWAPLDQGVHGRGTIAVFNDRKVIQHLRGGLIDEVLVKEGDPVKKGQLLVKMNTIDAGALRAGTRAQYVTLKATEARLLAELDNKRQITFSRDIARQPEANDAKSVQAALFKSRRGALSSELSAIQENIAGQVHNVTGLEQSLQSKKEQVTLLSQQLSSIKELATAGYYAKNRVLEMERNLAELNASVDATVADIGRARSTIAEWKYKLVLRQQEDRKEIESTLTDLQKELAQTQSKLKPLDFAMQNAEIRSPSEGRVVGLVMHTGGEVIAPGGKIMEIVPDKDPLIVEAKFSPTQIDKLRPKLPADLHFMALNRPDVPVVVGEVMTVSADQMDDPYTHAPFFLVRIKVSEQEIQKLRDHKLEIQPGMPLDVMVKTGEQTFLSYLLDPLKERMTWALSQ
jgi:protease secretion system membrane fusion protein